MMMAMDWQEQLAAFRQANPDLPDGAADDSSDADEIKTVRQPRLDVGIERKGRAGKTATLITGWQLPDEELLSIASDLKRKLGVGGSARGGDILLQGDRRKEVVALLQQMGFKARQI